MADVKPFKISIPDEAIKLLKDKLAVASLPDETEFSDDWGYGAPLSDIKRLVERWRNGFDWRKHEAELNKFSQFTSTVSVEGFDDLEIHFVHQRSSKPGAVPLLFCHGWPGSFVEVTKILPLLTEPEDGAQAFHVIAPSLPNFGFSDRVTKPGFSTPQCAEAVHKIMLKLGYKQYVTQGGDWGYWVTRMLGILYPESCLASHVNFAWITGPPDGMEEPVGGYSAQEKAGLERAQWFIREGMGYNYLQRTRPSTLAFALRDSPVALLAWLYEKLHDWTDAYAWEDDELLAWVSVYQFSKAGPQASSYIYYEHFHGPPRTQELLRKVDGYVEGVPLGISLFPQDVSLPPSAWLRVLGPVVFQRRHVDGGHFAAYERPKELVADVRETFARGKLDDTMKKLRL